MLAAVINSPDDNGPRYAYADWCQQNGDPERAEFIRVQCALFSNPLDDNERNELNRREQELLNERGWDWAEEFGLDITEWVFERGFIERVEMRLETSAEHILHVLSKAPIRHLRDDSQMCTLDGVVDALPGLGHLTGLEFWWLYAVDDALVRQLLLSPALQNLKTLVLHHDRNGNLIDDEVLIEGLHSPYRENLEELAVNVDCDWRGPSNAVVGAIADSPYLRKLRKLNLSNAGYPRNSGELTVDVIKRLASSANLDNLEELDLRGTLTTEDVWSAILDMPQLDCLERLLLCEAAEAGTHWIPIAGWVGEMPRWRDQFEQRVANIDWESRFIDPWNGGVWRGLSWSDRKKQFLFAMHPFIRDGDYDGLERRYRDLCEELSGKEATERVDKLDFDTWQAQIEASLPKVLSIAHKRASDTVFLRIRPDLDWSGAFGIHDKYSPSELSPKPIDPSKPFEEYSYSPPNAYLAAPSFASAAEVFKESPIPTVTGTSGPAVYLLARSVSAFGRCLAEFDVRQHVYFSCIWAVFRMT